VLEALDLDAAVRSLPNAGSGALDGVAADLPRGLGPPGEPPAALADTTPVFRYGAARFDEVPDAVSRLGLGRRPWPEGVRLATDLWRRLDAVRARGAAAPKVRVFIDAGALQTVDVNRPLARAVQLAGGTLIRTSPGPVSLVRLRRFDPQVWLVLPASGTRLALLRRRDDTKGIDAVRTGRVVPVREVDYAPDMRLPAKLDALIDLLHRPAVVIAADSTAPAGGGHDLVGVTLDALGTVVRLEDPVPRLQASLRDRLRLDVPPEACRAALRAEMRHYRAHCRTAGRCGDAGAAAARLCGRAGRRSRPRAVRRAGAAVPARRHRLLALPGRARGARPARRGGPAAGGRLELGRLPARDAPDLGIDARFSAVLTSADTGSPKPQPELFRRAAAALDAPAQRLLHVGDDPAQDVDGARAAGFAAVLLQRDTAPDERTPRIRTLLELPGLLGSHHNEDGATR
jgi:putative hydrolase of the HAD superfamily